MMGKEKNRKSAFECEYCGIKITSQVHFERHLRSHTGEKPYSCPLCVKAFSIESNFRRHVRTHSGERPFKCDICSGRFTAKESLVKHMRRHSGENLYCCDICNQSFTQSSHLNAHKRIHTGERDFKCPKCDKCFNNKYTFKLHCTMHENITHTCQGCGKVFDHLGSYQQHIRRHMKLKSYDCSVCGKQFPGRCVLLEHYSQIHAKEVHYHCPVCGKNFNKIAYLKRHSAIHKKFKPHLCTVCNARFANGAEFNDHLDDHTSNGFFYCPCDKKLSTKSKFRFHMTTHESETMKCFGSAEKCKSFHGLQEHQHNFTVAFMCPLCDREFERKVGVIRHVRTVHKEEEEMTEKLACEDTKSMQLEKSFKCSECETYFQKELSQKFHEVCVHKIVKEVEIPGEVEEPHQLDGGRSKLDVITENKKSHQGDAVICGSANSKDKARERVWEQNGTVVQDGVSEADQPQESVLSEDDPLLPECDVIIKDEPSDLGTTNRNTSKMLTLSPLQDSDESYDPQEPNSKSSDVSVKKVIIETYMNQYRKSFHCSLCRKKFRTLEKLESHMGFHTGENPFVCTICNLSFKKKQSLKMHVLSHGTGSMQCPHCHMSFSSKKGFKRHVSIHRDKLPFCLQCKRKFLSESALQKHMELHDNKELCCSKCQKTFSREYYLKFHLENQLCRSKKYSCYFCMRVFRSKGSIMRHVQVIHSSAREDPRALSADTDRAHGCRACDMTFSSQQGCIWHEVCVHKLADELDPHDVRNKVLEGSVKDDNSLEEKKNFGRFDTVLEDGDEIVFSEPIEEDAMCHDSVSTHFHSDVSVVKKENFTSSADDAIVSNITLPENEIFIKEEVADC